MSAQDQNTEVERSGKRSPQVRPTKGGSRRDLTALSKEIDRREATGRALLHDDPFLAKWYRMANLSPDDFE